MTTRDASPPADTVSGRDDSEAVVAEALVGARPTEPAGRLLAQARIARAFFGPEAAGRLGRFRVLERLGVGGMGIVYAAYDPDLDRGVALKLVRVPGLGRDAALAEAKALARLSHPNVVPVFDVGLDGDHVYIVMELVRGQTLRAWVKGRDQDEILAAYRQAGEALVAAHAAGLVHRDVKPDNAIVGDDGRIRVVDFGLACEAADPDRGTAEAQRVAGTPRYMAPEQAAGAPVDAAADQYSFCVALAEALGQDRDGGGEARPGAPGLPRWLAAVIARGTAPAPSARYPSMRELLRSLARDPARIRTRRIALAALVVAAAAALVIGRFALARGDDVCREGPERLTASWPDAARIAALRHLASLGDYGQRLAPRLDAWLGDHQRRWVAGYRAACLARRGALESESLTDRRMVCLDRGRVARRSVADVVGAADAGSLPEVVLAVRALPDPDACGDLAAVQSELALPPPALAVQVAAIRARLEDARIQVAAGRFDRAGRLAQAALIDARASGYRPLIAEALLLVGRAALPTDTRDRAIPALTEAVTVALEIGADALAIEAWARRAWMLGSTGAADQALDGLQVVDALAARTPSRFARALLDNNVGGVELDRDQRDRARDRFQRALGEARTVMGPGAVELLSIRVNLGRVTDDPARRDAILATGVAELARLLGDDHPQTLDASWLRAAMTTPLPDAARLLRPTCERLALHPGLAARSSACWFELGLIERERGDDAAAIDAMARAARIDGAGTRSPEAAAYLLLWRGQPAAAADRFTAIMPPPDAGEPWWERDRRADLELGLGMARAATGEAALARRALAASVESFAAVASAHRSPRVERRLARARAELGAVAAAKDGATGR